MKLILTTSIFIRSGYLSLCILLLLFQKYLIYFPQKSLTVTPQTAGLVYEDVYLQTGDGIKIHGWSMKADPRFSALSFSVYSDEVLICIDRNYTDSLFRTG
jgi:hypothetical protein